MEVSKNGDKVYWTLNAANNGSSANTNVKVQITIPAGLVIETYAAEKGTLNKTTGLWTVGSVAKDASYKNIVTFKVTDISLATEESGLFGFEVVAVMTGDNIDPNSINNTKTGFIEIVNCPPVAGAVADINACYCGTVAANDTICSRGNTEYRITVGSIINMDPEFTINVQTGDYNANGQILDLFEEASFTYSIWCVIGDDAYEVSGPVPVTFPPMLREEHTDSMEVGEDQEPPLALGLTHVKHTALDGQEDEFDIGWAGWDYWETTIISNITFTLEMFIAANFVKVNDSGYVDIQINIPAPSTLGLGDHKTFQWTFKRINAWDGGSITLVAGAGKTIDGQASYVFPDNDYTSITLWTDGTNYFVA